MQFTGLLVQIYVSQSFIDYEDNEKRLFHELESLETIHTEWELYLDASRIPVPHPRIPPKPLNPLSRRPPLSAAPSLSPTTCYPCPWRIPRGRLGFHLDPGGVHFSVKLPAPAPSPPPPALPAQYSPPVGPGSCHCPWS